MFLYYDGGAFGTPQFDRRRIGIRLSTEYESRMPSPVLVVGHMSDFHNTLLVIVLHRRMSA